jgi:hypothetical protein
MKRNFQVLAVHAAVYALASFMLVCGIGNKVTVERRRWSTT